MQTDAESSVRASGRYVALRERLGRFRKEVRVDPRPAILHRDLDGFLIEVCRDLHGSVGRRELQGVVDERAEQRTKDDGIALDAANVVIDLHVDPPFPPGE